MSDTPDKPKRRNPADHLPKAGRKDFHTLSPKWQAGQAKRAQAAAVQEAAAKAIEAGLVEPGTITVEPRQIQTIAPQSSTPSHDVKFHDVVKNQAHALHELSTIAVEAAQYIGKVVRGKVKGEQWRVRGAEFVLQSIAATGSTVERAQIAAQAASSAGADLGAMLTKLVEARALAARKADATDAETGQTSGKPDSE